MGVVRVSLPVERPADDVFHFAADQRNRCRLLPDNFTDIRMLTEQSTEPGARFAFTIRTDRDAYESVTELVATTPPISFIERTSDGAAAYQTEWRIVGAEGVAVVTMETSYPPSRGLLARWTDRLLGQTALRRGMMLELVRLKQALEGGGGGGGAAAGQR